MCQSGILVHIRNASVLLLSLLVSFHCSAQNEARKKAATAPVYVPLDSWIYPAVRRLAAMGYVPDLEGLAAPWTRAQCATLVEEAEDIASSHAAKTASAEGNREALNLLSALEQEFPSEPGPKMQGRVESIYTRIEEISATPLRDSYHFGQTLVNDYGRPYASGLNTVDGFSAYGTLGRFSIYFRGEYQEAGSGGSYNQSIRTLIGSLDGLQPRSSISIASVSRFTPLEMYAAAPLEKFNIAFGNQSVWWGPGQDSAFAFSNNAAPFYSLRLDQQEPIQLPGVFRYLGHIRTQFLVGELSGHTAPPKPLINAQKITFQLSKDLEIGFTRSSLFGGVGHPLTASSILDSFFSTSSTGNTTFGSANDPGDRRSGFDFEWRVPGLRRYLTVYSDSLADDEPNPIDSLRRSAWAPGLYIAQIPGLRHADFRFETYSTWLYRGDEGGKFFYWNNQYRDAYTNDGNLLGSWIGRDSRAYDASASYWLSAQSKVSFSFRQIKAGSNFLPGGGTQTDGNISAQWQIRPQLMASAFVQFERYFLPVLGGPQSDVATGLQFTFTPHNWGVRK